MKMVQLRNIFSAHVHLHQRYVLIALSAFMAVYVCSVSFYLLPATFLQELQYQISFQPALLIAKEANLTLLVRLNTGAADAGHIASQVMEMEPRSSTSTSNSHLTKILEPFGVSEYHTFRNTPVREDRLPITMLVHHREFLPGCHTFERFFNPKWETIVVVEVEMAEHYQLKELAQQAKSPGVHLVLLNNKTNSGEWLGRQLAIKIMDQQEFEGAGSTSTSTRPPLLLSTQCDIQPLHEWHAMHKSYEDTVSRMVHEFREEERLIQLKQTNVNDARCLFESVPLDSEVCGRVFSRKDRPLFVLNTAMVETIPSTESLEGSTFHSLEAGLSEKWKTRFSRPDALPTNKPWMSDISTWVEDHFVLYNVTMLAEIVDVFAGVDVTINDGVRAIAHLLCKKGWKAVRLNDEPMFYDVAKSQLESSGPAGKFKLHVPSKYGSVSLDWLFRKSILDLAGVNSPLGCLREYMRLRTMTNVDVHPSCIIAHQHLQPNHIPSTVWLKEIRENESTVEALMQIHGYVCVKRSEEALIFVSIPSFHTQPHSDFVSSLQEGTSGIVSGVVPGGADDLKYIQLLRNSTLQSGSLFTGHTLRNKYAYHRERRLKYGAAAARVCQLLKSSQHSRQDDGGNTTNTSTTFLTQDEALKAMVSIADSCREGFPWKEHDLFRAPQNPSP